MHLKAQHCNTVNISKEYSVLYICTVLEGLVHCQHYAIISIIYVLEGLVHCHHCEIISIILYMYLKDKCAVNTVKL